MVEDWLNPELTGGDAPHVGPCAAPQVQHKQAGDSILAGQLPCPGPGTSAGTSASAQQKNLKVNSSSLNTVGVDIFPEQKVDPFHPYFLSFASIL